MEVKTAYPLSCNLVWNILRGKQGGFLVAELKQRVPNIPFDDVIDMLNNAGLLEREYLTVNGRDKIIWKAKNISVSFIQGRVFDNKNERRYENTRK